MLRTRTSRVGFEVRKQAVKSKLSTLPSCWVKPNLSKNTEQPIHNATMLRLNVVRYSRQYALTEGKHAASSVVRLMEVDFRQDDA
jgi:hypothetical protein